jgi:hypothetical protein
LEAPGPDGRRANVLSKLRILLGRWFLYAQRLFHVLVGLAFFLLAAAGVVVCFSEWRFHHREPSIGLVRFGMVAGFTVVLIIFGLYSFVKARSVR